MDKLWIALMLTMLVALPYCGSSDDDNSDPDAGTDTDSDSDADSGSNTDCDADGDSVGSTLVLTLGDDAADAGLDAGGFMDNCENGLGGSSGKSYAWGYSDQIQWGITDNENSSFYSEVSTWHGAPSSPGTYIIDADEADYATCGICLFVLSSASSTSYMPVADSGSITFNDYNIADPVGEEFSGTFSVIMQEVDVDFYSQTSSPVVGGCRGFLSGTWSGIVGTFPDSK